MNFSIPVYESTFANGEIVWRSITLPETVVLSGRHNSKIRSEFTKQVKTLLQKAYPEDVRSIAEFRDIRLRAIRLEFKNKQKETITGLFPIAVATRALGEYGSLDIVFHPLRPDDWFVLDRREDATEQANWNFRRQWFLQSSESIDQLRMPQRQKIRTISLSCQPKSLLSQLNENDADSPRKLGPQKPASGSLVVLPQIATDLTSLASEKDLELPRTRAPYSEILLKTFKGTGRRALVLLGPPGVGKRSLVSRFVHDLLGYDDFDNHRDLNQCETIWSISGRRLIAGMSYVGQWEERCVEILEDLQRQRAILDVTDIHAWGRIGQTVNNDRALADFFRGPIARGECAVVACTTPDRWQRLESDAPAFTDLFTTITVDEPDHAETFSLMFSTIRRLESKHPVLFNPVAIRTILELCESVMTHRAFPGKAIEMLESMVLETGDSAYWEVDAASVFASVGSRTGIPRDVLDSKRVLNLEALREEFSRFVKGQDEAVDVCVDIIAQIKAGVCRPNQPYHVVMFSGPTGTGKTELAKCLAAYLYGSDERLVRFDMSEFSGPDAVSRLAGDRYQPDGLLTNAVRKEPFCVILLDEIEKAHPSALNLLLQVFDDGRLADAEGRIANFSHAVIIMTSNLGADTNSAIGFGDDSGDDGSSFVKAVESFFAPELFNRIDRVVGFRSLSREVATKIARKELQKLLSRHGLTERRIFVTPTDQVLEKIVADGFDKRDGARSVKRYLEDTIGSLLSEAIASGGAALLRSYSVYVKDDEFHLHLEALREADVVAESALEPLLAANRERLTEALSDAKTFAVEVRDSTELTEAIETIRTKLVGFNSGDTERADQIFSIDGLRHALDEQIESIDRILGAELWDDEELLEGQLMRRVELKGAAGFDAPMIAKWSPRVTASLPKQPSRDEALMMVAESHFLKRTLKTVDDPSKHHATILISIVGEADASVRFGEKGASFLSDMARGMVANRCVLATVAGFKDGRCFEGEFADVLRKKPTMVAIEVVGFGIRDWLSVDTGCHMMSSLGTPPEVVRVEIRPGSDALAVVEGATERRAAFLASLEHEPLDNPDALLPLIRSYTALGKRGSGQMTTIEDFRIAWSGKFAGKYERVADGMRAMNHAAKSDDV